MINELKQFVNSRTQIQFRIKGDDKLIWLRNPSFSKNRIAQKLYNEYPYCKSIEFFSSLTGKPNMYVIDYDEITFDMSVEGLSYLIKMIRNFNLPYPFVKTSGSKGFHLQWKTNNSLEDMTQITMKMNEVIRKDNIISPLDLHCYRSNVIRAYYSINFNSNEHARAVRYNGLGEIVEEQGFKASHFNIDNYPEAVLPVSTVPKPECSITQKIKRIIKPDEKMRPCIEAILDEGATEGKRNSALTALILYYCSIGYTPVKIKEILFDWNNKNHPPLKEKEISSTVDYLYVKQYMSLGCEKLKQMGLCTFGKFCYFI